MRIRHVLLLVAVAAAVAAAEEVTPSPPSPVSRPALVLVPFGDSSPTAGTEFVRVPGQPFDLKEPMPWLGDGIPAVLEFTLERAAAVNIIPRTDFATALLKRRNAELNTATPADVVKDLARREGATHIVSGVFSKDGTRLTFTVNVASLEGNVVLSKEYACEIQDIFAATDAAAGDILTAVGVADPRLIPRVPTRSLEALMSYARAASKVNTGERIGNLSLAVHLDPDFAEAYLRLGDAYRQDKIYDEARAAYERSRELADYYPSAAVGLATVTRKTETENFDGVAAFDNEALAIDPYYAPAYDSLGALYFAQGKYTEAAAAYAKFSEIWPTNKDGYYALGNSLWLGGKDNPQWKQILTQAIEAYAKALAVDDEFSACHYNIASVYKIFEDVDKATFHYRRYVELEPNSPKRAEIEATIADWEAKYKKKPSSP